MTRHLIRASVLLTALGLCAACRSQANSGSVTRKPVSTLTPGASARPNPATRVARGGRGSPASTTGAAGAGPQLHNPAPVLDLRRGTGSFPLGPQPVDSPASLSAALAEGYARRLDHLTPRNTFSVTGAFPALQSLVVDVSGARVKPSYRPARFDKTIVGQRELTVARLVYAADPLFYDTASVRATLTAEQAHVGLLSDAKGDRGLVLLGARHGRMSFHITTQDIQAMLAAGARHGDDEGVFAIQQASVSFSSDDPHALTGTLHIRARWLLLPMSFSVHGRITADPGAGTLTYRDLSVTGHDAGGDLAAAFINPAIKRMNGRTQPMVAFGDDTTHVIDVRFTADGGVGLTVEFGR